MAIRSNLKWALQFGKYFLRALGSYGLGLLHRGAFPQKDKPEINLKASLLRGFVTNKYCTFLFSIIIMPSEFGDEKKKQLTQPSPSITYPVASQTYRCIETYETKDTKNRPFKVAKGEIVEVLIKDMTGMFHLDCSLSASEGNSKLKF